MIPRNLVDQKQNETKKLKRQSSSSKQTLLQYNESDENLLQFSEDSEDREERLAKEAQKQMTEEEKQALELELQRKKMQVGEQDLVGKEIKEMMKTIQSQDQQR